MATNGTLLDVYQSNGSGTAAAICAGAFTNPSSLDLIQVINEGGTVVWNFTSAGVANVNPASPSLSGGRPTALLKQLFGATLAAAIASAANTQEPLDLIQIYSNVGQALLLHVSNTGVVTTP